MDAHRQHHNVLGGLGRLFGDSNHKTLKQFQPIVDRVNILEPKLLDLDNTQLQRNVLELRSRLESGTTLNELLPAMFATVREAAKRTLGQRHFDVQLLGAIALHQGKIAEMKTGEGKTLVSTLPAATNALTGQGVHIVTVNDYLAKRDTVWMGPIYDLLGFRVGCLQHDSAYIYDPSNTSNKSDLRNLLPVSRREAYRADILYGTNNEFGFDYLRDNMALDLSQTVQRKLYYAIVDEVDNILIDEARTPLIISGPAQESTQLYSTFANLVPRLQGDTDYGVDAKTHTVSLSESGISKMEHWLHLDNLYDPQNYYLVHFIENALKAQVIYKRNTEYLVQNGTVVIVDEFTGRLMWGRRYSDGLHQAIEAKEGVKVQRESITYATVTLQNYFRMYHKLAGMTGTAATESEEFWKIYKLDTVVIPTHKPMIREGMVTQVYKTEEGKLHAIVKEIAERHKHQQPILAGTTSIEKSERLGELLRRRGIPCQILNAKFHEKEASVVSQAGRAGAVTVATNMAGRGTDIILGGNPEGMLTAELLKHGKTWDSAPPELLEKLELEIKKTWEHEHNAVINLGGVHVIGTEHHEARRVDNQLRGRSGRQGDPGSSRFYASLEDDVLRRFGGDRIKGFMNLAGIDEDTPLESKIVGGAISSAQMKVEAYHFDIRKHLLNYDDVLNKHREIIYDERYKILNGTDLRTNIVEMIHQEVRSLVALFLPTKEVDNWNLDAWISEIQTVTPMMHESTDKEQLALMTREAIQEKAIAEVAQAYFDHEHTMGIENARILERLVMLRAMDTHWVRHLTAMEELREGVSLQAVGQRDPLVAYRTEGHRKFQELKDRISHDIVHTIYHVGLNQQTTGTQTTNNDYQASPMATASNKREGWSLPVGAPKAGRNNPCPCGSGKKYKKCHGI